MIGRDRDLPSLKQLGLVEVIARGQAFGVTARIPCSGLRVGRQRFVPPVACKLEVQLTERTMTCRPWSRDLGPFTTPRYDRSHGTHCL